MAHGWDRVWFNVEFDAPFGDDSLRVAFAAIRAAVADNWRDRRDRRDRLSKAGPPRPVDVEGWLRDLRVNSLMEPIFDEIARGTGTGRQTPYQSYAFSFSPISYWGAEVTPWRVGEEHLRLFVDAPDRVLREDGGERVRRWGDGFDDRRGYEADPWPDDAPRCVEDPGFDAWHEAWFAPYAVQVGPANRACLRAILDRLCEALPVRHFELDGALKDPADQA